MKNLIITFLLLWAGVAGATTAFEPYVVRNNSRTAEETVRQLEGSPFLWEFQKELQKNTPYHFGHLTKAVEDGMLVSRQCGDCSLETAGIRNGKTIYHRHVESDEVVAYLKGVPLFLPACGNPVRPLRGEDVTPTPPAPPVVQPAPQPAPVTPPPQAKKEPPRVPPSVCSPDKVSYTTETTILPGTSIGPWFGWWQPDYFSPGSISMTISHHDWVCVQDMPPETETKMEE